MRKHEQSKKGVVKELFSEIGVFLVKKGSNTTLQAAKIWKIGKIRKSWSMTKNRSSEIFAVKMEFFFLKKPSWSAKFFPSPKLGARSPPIDRFIGIRLIRIMLCH